MAQLALFILGWLLLVAVVGGVLLLIWAIWALVDAFLIPGMVEADTQDKRSRLASDLSMMAIEK